jgi:excisionase family DNA binding protein
MQVEGTRMYRVKDVAEHFDVSVSTIYRAIESGQLDALKLGTGQGTLRVPGCAVLAYAARCGQASTEASVTGQAAGVESVGEVSQ